MSGISPAIARLQASINRSGSYLSVGLEPSDEYLPEGYPRSIDGHRQFLLEIIRAGADCAGAFKINIAFFESLGKAGYTLLEEIREAIPANSYLILDAKRGDIGSTAKHYAKAAFEVLRADSITVNPLMGSDSVTPFLEYEDKLTFLLTLTSNPGAADFLLRDRLYTEVARKASEWNVRGNVGMVAGATRPEYLGEINGIAPGIPFLLPGVGAQGGSLEGVVRSLPAELPYLIHQTRSLLPKKAEPGEAVAIIRERIHAFNSELNKVRETQP